MKATVSSDGNVVIYRDEDATVGVGLQGGYQSRKIEFLYGHRIDPLLSETKQLFPVDEHSAFTCAGGHWDFMVNPSNSIPNKWDYEPRDVSVYTLTNGQLSTAHSLKDIGARYSLQAEETFLGRIDNVVFFWANYDARQVYWRRVGEAEARAVKLPHQVVDIYGVTRGIHKAYGLVVFRNSSGLSAYAPYAHEFWEFDLKPRKGGTS